MVEVASFRQAFKALHDVEPFRWQERAARELATEGWWGSLTAPTGAGKTSLIDAWLWALATAGPDRLGRRLFWVVDRRAVVDQVHAYSRRVFDEAAFIADNGTRTDGVPVSDEGAAAITDLWRRLAAIGSAGDDAGPVATLWRGGLDDVTREQSTQLLDASRVAVVCSTLDQVGSRLLFRGYGTRGGSRAAHAGLVGTDATIVLDEAHLAEPFRQTLGRVRAIQAAALRPPRPGTRVVTVTATPGAASPAEAAFTLTGSELSDNAIAVRLEARKTVRLQEKASSADAAAAARRLATRAPSSVVGVVMNTVAQARAVFDALDVGDDGVLLIGPVRPIDRTINLPLIPSRIERAERDRPFYVVATQTIEVGVDLDLDGLVTACAPVPSLVQRLGRLDRVGTLRESSAVVLAPPRKGCPVYGDDTRDAWDWLLECGARESDGVDLGPAALAELDARTPWPRPNPTDDDRAPVLLPLHVETLSWIDAGPEETPEIDLFIHGARETSPEVAIIWRVDLPTEDGDEAKMKVSERLGLRPPHSGEALPISLAAARRWLRGEPASSVADVPTAEADESSGSAASRAAWRIVDRSYGTIEVEPLGDPADLRAGDTLVVPAAAGGCDCFGWAPDSSEAVPDLGSLAAGRPRIVGWLDDDGDDLYAEPIQLALDGAMRTDDLRDLLMARIEAGLPSEQRYAQHRRAALGALRGGDLEILGGGAGVLLVPRSPRKTSGGSPSPIALDAHQEAVARRVAEAADALELADELRESLKLAALHHDEGKRDPRFQAWLSDGAPHPFPLAKSTYVATAARIASKRRTAGWPDGKRHEITSALLIATARPDLPLAAWLALTHHGRNRPYPRCPEDPVGNEVAVGTTIDGQAVSIWGGQAVDAAWTMDSLEDLTRDRGPWGLALLEATVITADHAASREGDG